MPPNYPCDASFTALSAIADAAWSPYISGALQDRAARALGGPDACASPSACAGCATCRTIIDLPFSPSVAHHIQELARDARGRNALRDIPQRRSS